MKSITGIILATIGLHTSNSFVMLITMFLTGLLIYKTMKDDTKK